ncbi:MAG TPA: TIM-barrel domain-containing protein [Gemmatimonadales bacterium]|jgi:alpha-glucosidase/alpha-D-xyloside xylohydrolase
MADHLTRREAVQRLGAVSAALAVPVRHSLAPDLIVGGTPVELSIAVVSPVTVRLTMQPLINGKIVPLPDTGELAQSKIGRVAGRTRTVHRERAGTLVVDVTAAPPSIRVTNADGNPVQQLTFDPVHAGVSFQVGPGPLLGLGEGGPQFDRRGTVERMINGSDGYRLSTNGIRAPIQWVISTGTSALFIHAPSGAFDFTGADATFAPHHDTPAPFDCFVVASADPAVVMREYARITGFADMPPRWGFGYLQSHRTLAGPTEIFGIAETFRQKRLPCDALIYLGTEFAPSGWNTRNGEFTWHPVNFPNPRQMLSTLHDRHFKVVLHSVIEGHHLIGNIHNRCTAPEPSGRTADNHWPDDRHVACYWPYHKGPMDDGADGWWPDQGDDYDVPSEINRHRMYWEGSQQYRPNERPFALHRNAAAGVQRYGSFIWSGDVQSRWETLKTHIPVALNAGLSGLPFWGTDIGGFSPTAEYTGELHVRWFQFGAFCPLFRAHGRNWHLRLPWGWDGGDGGPPESGRFHVDPAELHNAAVEPICRQYLELRSRLMPYLYTAVRECHETGMPIMRALWLHYPNDPVAVARADCYLWGRDLLVAPVVEKGATSRSVYLPRGDWFDFWTGQRVAGGRELQRPVDLATIPLYLRAGAIVPFGPVRQYVDEPVDSATTIAIYPGTDGDAQWYDDDGHTFDYRRGESTTLRLKWNDAARILSVSLAAGSWPRGTVPRRLDVRVIGSNSSVPVTFSGHPIEIKV